MTYDPTVSFRCNPDVVARIDQLARENHRSRSQEIQHLLALALKRLAQEPENAA